MQLLIAHLNPTPADLVHDRCTLCFDEVLLLGVNEARPGRILLACHGVPAQLSFINRLEIMAAEEHRVIFHQLLLSGLHRL